MVLADGVIVSSRFDQGRRDVLLPMRIALEVRDFVDATLMAAAEVGGGQESLHHFDGGFGGDNATAERQDIGVIVFAGEPRGGDVVSEAGANAGDFFGGNGTADAWAA